jgi:GNAT superfamily N-acetyltransferase
VRVVAPEERHLTAVMALSEALAAEDERLGRIPVGMIRTAEQAWCKVYGPDVVAARVAENDDGQLAGLATVTRFEAGFELSVMVAARFRRRGLARQLVEAVLGPLPAGTTVEAWVAEWNRASLAALQALGFRPTRIIEDGRERVHILTRKV